jgi:hypothetical protein
MREVNRMLTPSPRRHVSTCLSHGPTLWFCHVSLVPSFALHDFCSPSAASFVSRHPKCRGPELLDTPYRNSRLRTFGTKVSTPNPWAQTLRNLRKNPELLLRISEMLNSDSLLMRVPQQNFSPCRDFTLRDFANLDARFSVLQLVNPEVRIHE